MRAVDGRTGVAALRDGFAQLVVVDAFVGARVPAELGTAEFLADVRRVLGPDGVLALNLTDRGPFGYARRVLAGLRTTFAATLLCAEPSTIKGRRFGNVVLVGADRELPLTDLAALTGRAPFPYRVLHGDRLVQLLGGAAPWTEADASTSPDPPTDLLRLG